MSDPVILSFSNDVASRIVALHDAASDADSYSPVLSGVCLRSAPISGDTGNGDALIIVATDGKLLMEERWTLDAGTLQDGEAILPADGIHTLSLWMKSLKAVLGKRPSCTMECTIAGRMATFRVPGLMIGECAVRLVEGSFPNYLHALNPADKPATPDRIGYNLAYFAAVAKAWKRPKLDITSVEAKHYRGTVLRLLRLPIGCQSALALIMDITLPS